MALNATTGFRPASRVGAGYRTHAETVTPSRKGAVPEGRRGFATSPAVLYMFSMKPSVGKDITAPRTSSPAPGLRA